jgi:hypothetical protein
MPRKALTKRQQRNERQRQWLKRVGADAFVVAAKRSPNAFEIWCHYHTELGYQSLRDTPTVIVLYHVPGQGWKCVDEAVSVEQMLRLLRIADRKPLVGCVEDDPSPEAYHIFDKIFEVAKLRIIWTARGRQLATALA